MPDYSKAEIRSADGTAIGYRQYGEHGPGLLLVHGGMKAAQHFSTLAADLADTFRVYVPDRRGRGRSGPHGPHYGVQREVEDLRALLAATGTEHVFGHSSGALVTLRTALQTPRLRHIALYEPPLMVEAGAIPTAWLPRYERELDTGHPAAALITALKGTGLEPTFSRVPRFALTPVIALGLRVQRPTPDEATIADLIPTQRYDMRLVRELSGTLPDYSGVPAQALLLGGTRSPAYLRAALDALEEVLPHAQRHTFAALTHEAPENDGRPHTIAAALRQFFA
ncbi:alpha/beta fold hydrolase [Dactylosporangium sp. NPDC051541]|uniref:alpha/beta fold hydrolase n=1 Tax=Dactylosporangium sp. NPDC051541 TaxID=3363977 RepID=UPI00379A1D0D